MGLLVGDVKEYGTDCRRRGGERTPIRFEENNIRNGGNGGLELALRGMGQANMDVGVFHKTNLTDGIYTRGSEGYRVVATSVPSRHHGGIAILYWYSPNFAVEEIYYFGVNVIMCQFANGETALVHHWMLPGAGRRGDN